MIISPKNLCPSDITISNMYCIYISKNVFVSGRQIHTYSGDILHNMKLLRHSNVISTVNISYSTAVHKSVQIIQALFFYQLLFSFN